MASAPSARGPKLSWPSKCITDNFTYGRFFDQLRSLRVRVWTSEISWSAIAPTKPRKTRSPADPAYRWPAGLGKAVKEARAAGIEPVLFVNDFPRWTNGGREPMWAALRPRDYADFMAAAVRRYPQVRRWILLSEPTSYVNFRPQGNGGKRAPQIYARLLDAAYGAMHAVRRDVVVIGGNVHPAGFNDETTTAPDTFLKYMVLPNGRRPRLDMFGVNPYTERTLDLHLPHLPNRVDFNDLDWLISQLDRHWPGQRLKLFIIEFGWNTEHAAEGWLYFVPREKQAADLAKAYSLASRLGRIDTMCWFLLYDMVPNRDGERWVNWTSGLGTSTGARKPAWQAFTRVPPGPPRVPARR
jgi:hypothetical protein